MADAPAELLDTKHRCHRAKGEGMKFIYALGAVGCGFYLIYELHYRMFSGSISYPLGICAVGFIFFTLLTIVSRNKEAQ